VRTDFDLPADLRRHVPRDAEIIAQAPGRANLIGEHTDYNEGFVLPAALELRTVVAGRRADRIRLRSIGHSAVVEVDAADGRGPTAGWGRYVTAVVRTLIHAGVPTRGIDGVVASNLPTGTGLSSSAALEVALVMALVDEPMEPRTLAELCRRAENVHVGVRSGIMDPLASAAARAGFGLFIDCRSIETADVRIPPDLRLLIVDSGQRRELSAGDYNLRRAECETAARLLGVRALRDVPEADLDATDLPEPLASRARHVVTENARTLSAVDALRTDDRPRLRELFAASHLSLARDFAVSTPQIDRLVDIAGRVEGIIATRMTGAGFGGCTVSLVDADHARRALTEIVDSYQRMTGLPAHGWISAPASGSFELIEA